MQDPEGLFKGGPQEGIIERKMFQQRVRGLSRACAGGGQGRAGASAAAAAGLSHPSCLAYLTTCSVPCSPSCCLQIEGDRDYERKMAEFAAQQAQEVAKKREVGCCAVAARGQLCSARAAVLAALLLLQRRRRRRYFIHHSFYAPLMPTQSREVPEATEALVEFFLDTEAPEMDYEIARCRPRLTPEFFSYLDKQIGGRGVPAGCGQRQRAAKSP